MPSVLNDENVLRIPAELLRPIKTTLRESRTTVLTMDGVTKEIETDRGVKTRRRVIGHNFNLDWKDCCDLRTLPSEHVCMLSCPSCRMPLLGRTSNVFHKEKTFIYLAGFVESACEIE